MTDTLTAGGVGPDVEATAACGCCKPPPSMDVAQEVMELQGRREIVERRLAGFGAAPS